MLLSNIAKQFLMQTKATKSLVNRTAACFLSTQQTTTTTPTESPAAETAEAQQQQQQQVIDPAEFKALEEKLVKAETSAADFKDRYMRALAETENVRTRMVKVRN